MSRLSCLFLLSPLLALLPQVAAHGFVRSISIDGDIYEGSIPGQDQGASPIRTISTISPVKGATNSQLFCGQDAQFAAVDAPANSGSNVTLQWVGGATGDSNWPHEVGPLMTYMASCGGSSCTNFNNSDAQWFKIAESGQKPDGTTWYQADIMNGDAYSLTLPENLTPGGYLLRHEIISLQLASSMGGAEFYPMCAQLSIGGSGTGTPSPTVQFPGAYSDSDPGIYTPDVYNPGYIYPFPGGNMSSMPSAEYETVPAINRDAPFVTGSLTASAPSQTGSASGAAPSSATPSAPGVSAPASPSSAAPSASASAGAAKCRLRPSSAANSTASAGAGVSKRAHGRMMRRFRRAST